MTVQRTSSVGQAPVKPTHGKWWVCGALLLTVLAPAHAQVFSDNFGACSGTGTTETANTALSLSPPIQVRLFSGTTASCTGWTFAGNAWLAEYTGGTAFPGGATKAIWLNEPQGRMSRTISGLTVGRTYRLSAQTWTDNVNAPTALKMELGAVSTTYAMSAGSGPQDVGMQVCATTTSLDVSFSESGATESSPLVTNVRLDDLNQPCGAAVAATPVPVSSPWMWALLCALVCGAVARGRARLQGPSR